METKTKAELIRSIEAALDTQSYRKQLEAESITVLAKLNTLPSAKIRQLLDKATSKAIVASLKTGPQPEAFDAASLAEVNDHKHFYMHGKLCLQAIEDSTGEWWQARKGHMSIGATWVPLGRFASVEQAIKAYMVLEQYWPNCWFISDHGNAHLIDLNEGK